MIEQFSTTTPRIPATPYGCLLHHDEHGHTLQLHGLGLLRDGDRWIAYGENKVNGPLFQGVSCHETADFRTWTSHGTVLEPLENGHALGADQLGERPRVLRCPSTGRYVESPAAPEPCPIMIH